jgi:polyisoprenoid-binding protein YceI
MNIRQCAVNVGVCNMLESFSLLFFNLTTFFSMKNNLSVAFFILIIGSFLGCSEPVKEKTAAAETVALQAGDAKYVAIDTNLSVITWKGANSFGTHTGYVRISKGRLMMEDGQLVGGTVEVDMTTIEDENHDSDNGLIQHLKDPDFFNVAKFPVAAIVITKVAPKNAEEKAITGNLTIKSMTHPVSFPARIEVKDGLVTATGKLVIDRTRWGVHYGSGKLFDNFKNEIISDDIEFNVKLVGRQ